MKRMTIVTLVLFSVNLYIAISTGNPFYYFCAGALFGCAACGATILVSDVINNMGDGAIPKRE